VLVVERTARGRAAYACAYLNAGVEFDGAERRDGVVRNRCQVGTDVDILHCVIHGESDVVNQLTDGADQGRPALGHRGQMRTLHDAVERALEGAGARGPTDTTIRTSLHSTALWNGPSSAYCAVPGEIVLGRRR
jgi:hypothetical protein